MAAGEVMPVARWTETISELKGFRQIGRQRGYHGGMTDPVGSKNSAHR